MKVLNDADGYDPEREWVSEKRRREREMRKRGRRSEPLPNSSQVWAPLTERCFSFRSIPCEECLNSPQLHRFPRTRFGDWWDEEKEEREREKEREEKGMNFMIKAFSLHLFSFSSSSIHPFTLSCFLRSPLTTFPHLFLSSLTQASFFRFPFIIIFPTRNEEQNAEVEQVCSQGGKRGKPFASFLFLTLTLTLSLFPTSLNFTLLSEKEGKRNIHPFRWINI